MGAPLFCMKKEKEKKKEHVPSQQTRGSSNLLIREIIINITISYVIGKVARRSTTILSCLMTLKELNKEPYALSVFKCYLESSF